MADKFVQNFKLNKIAARWPAKAVTQLFPKKQWTGMSQDSIV